MMIRRWFLIACVLAPLAALGQSSGSAQSLVDGQKATYRATVVGGTPVASSTAPWFYVIGSSTKTIRITHIEFSLADTSTGVAGGTKVTLQRFSALSGGTCSALTAAKNDTNDGSATAAVDTCTAVNTTATANGGATSSIIYPLTTGAATATIQPPYDWYFGSVPGARAVVLRGTSDFLGIEISAVGTTPVASISVEWTEE